jgi:hypothetical protein
MKFLQQQWTKGVLFEALNMPMSIWGPRGQIHGTNFVLQKRPSTVLFVEEWMRQSQNITLISDKVSRVPNHRSFKDHRHDQSILSLLVYKYGFLELLDPYHGGNAPRIIRRMRKEG